MEPLEQLAVTKGAGGALEADGFELAIEQTLGTFGADFAGEGVGRVQ